MSLFFDLRFAIFLLFNNITANVFAEHLGYIDAAVGILVLLYDGGENTAGGKSASVEGVDVLDLAVFTFNAHHAAASLV